MSFCLPVCLSVCLSLSLALLTYVKETSWLVPLHQISVIQRVRVRLLCQRFTRTPQHYWQSSHTSAGPPKRIWNPSITEDDGWHSVLKHCLHSWTRGELRRGEYTRTRERTETCTHAGKNIVDFKCQMRKTLSLSLVRIYYFGYY